VHLVGFITKKFVTSHERKIIYIYLKMYIFFNSGSEPLHYWGFTITPRHATLGRTPLCERPARRRNRYLTIHNTLKRQTSMPPAEFEPAIPASERPQTHDLDRAATGISN